MNNTQNAISLISNYWRKWDKRMKLAGGLLVSAAWLEIAASFVPASAQIVPDATLGAEISTILSNVNINNLPADKIAGGALRGANLFHSFSDFNVGDGQRVYFANPAGVENILTRVTGVNASQILGTLGVDGVANLFLINPNGILFGPNARLDIRGSFTASTANSLILGNGEKFSATNPESAPLLTVNVPIGLQYGTNQSAAITNQGNLSVGQNLTLAAGNLQLSGQLYAGGDLTLQASDTLQVRDSLENPFIAASGGKMLVQGDRAVDIFALNHPDSGFYSGSDMVFRSADTVGGDAHYWSGGNFRIEKLDGSLGSLSSPYDPVIKANGDVTLGSYSGASLHILAGGSVSLGNVDITGTDPTNFINENVTLSDGITVVNIDGSVQPALDVRAGIDWSLLGGLPGNIVNGSISPSPVLALTPPVATSADITIGSVTNFNEGIIFITNQYYPNTSLLNGKVQVTDINTSGFVRNGGSVTIDSRNSIEIAGDLKTGSRRRSGGNITLLANNIISTGNLLAASSIGGNVNLIANGTIITNGVSGTNVNIISNSNITTNGVSGVNVRIVSNSNIATGTVYSSGDIKIIAKDNIINSGTISGCSFCQYGGNIELVSQNGSIYTLEDIKSSGIVSSGKISISAKNNIYTKGISNFSYRDSGDIEIISHSGIIDTTGGNIMSECDWGKPGNVSITATSNIFTSQIGTFTYTGNNGFIRLTSLFGNIDTSTGYLFSETYDGQGGSIHINAFGSIRTGEIASQAVHIYNGKAGDIILNANNDITTGSIRSISKFRSGNINITTNGIFSSNNSVITADTSGSGKSGDITIDAHSIYLTNGTQISTSTSSSGEGGLLTLRASDLVYLGGITPIGQVPNGLFAQPGNPLGIPAGQQLSGFIPPAALAQQFANVQYPSGLFTQTSSTGNAGKIIVETGKLIMQENAVIAATTFGSGNGGDISIHAKELSLSNSSILSGVTPSASGSSGKIEIQTNSMSLDKGSIVQTLTLGQGSAGSINVTTNNIQINGVNPTQGYSSGLLSGSDRENSGAGGNINVIADNLQIANAGVISSRTFSNNPGGNIQVNAHNLEIVDGGQILTTTFSHGKAGDIGVNANDTISLSGSDSSFNSRLQIFGDTTVSSDGAFSGILARSQGTGNAGDINLSARELNLKEQAMISASTSSTGQGGNLNVFVDSAEVIQGSSILTQTSGGGNAGNLSITANRDLVIKDMGKIAVSSQDSGSAGNIKIQARSIFLDNQGKLMAETASGEGGNIGIKVTDSIIMRHNSEISAEAFGTGNGGNINIKAGNFVLAFLKENSDIVANAYKGRGGNIDITGTGVFGFRLNNKTRTSESDTTASSALNIDGVVTINTDYKVRFNNLPIENKYPESVTQRCQVGKPAKNMSFYRVGRSGLVSDAMGLLEGNDTWNDFRFDSVNSENINKASIVETSNNSNSHELVEAQGFIVTPEGKVKLVETAPVTTLYSSLQSPQTCATQQANSKH